MTSTIVSSIDNIMSNIDGRILDVDSHEMTPCHLWGETFGEAAGRIGELVGPRLRTGANDFYNPDVVGDVEAMTEENVWNIRGVRAPGAFDLARRIEVMDLMGVRRQLLFPSYAIWANIFVAADISLLRYKYELPDDISDADIRELGRQGLDEYNEWAIAGSRLAPDRIRPVAYVHAGESVDDLFDRALDLIDQGVRALCLPMTIPPGGHSPAHSELDRFWALLSDRNVVFTMHVGDVTGFTASSEWVKAEAFKIGKVESHELGLEPYSFATLHLAVTNYLTCMVLGGVFERHPKLRVGAIELGCSWLAPLATNLNMWAERVYATRLAPFIRLRPSEYLGRNVRVTPFFNFEPIEDFIANDPVLENCYCYSTDYPHIEGGFDSKNRFAQLLSHHSEATLEKFFYKNAELILPD